MFKQFSQVHGYEYCTVVGKKNRTFDFKLKYWPHYNFKKGHQGQFWKIQDERSSELSLVAEIDDRIRFSKHFVILGNVESLGLLDAQIGAGGRDTSMTQ